MNLDAILREDQTNHAETRARPEMKASDGWSMMFVLVLAIYFRNDGVSIMSLLLTCGLFVWYEAGKGR